VGPFPTQTKGAGKMSILSQIPKFMRKCPLCGFQECKERQCMFFIGFNDKDYECLFYQIHYNSFSAMAYAHYISLSANMPGQNLLDDISPQVLTKRLERIEETLEALDATTSLPLLEPRLLLRLQDAVKGLSEHAETLRATLKGSVKPQHRKRAGQKKD
jgi:hypothetical protein